MKAGEIIRRVRSERKMTQATLSVRTGIDPATIRKYENGQNPLTEKAVNKFAEAFSINPDAFIISEFTLSRAMHMLFLMYLYYGGEFKTIKTKEVAIDGATEEIEKTYISFYALEPLIKAWARRGTIKEALTGKKSSELYQFLECFPESMELSDDNNVKTDDLRRVMNMFDYYCDYGVLDYSYLENDDGDGRIELKHPIAIELLNRLEQLNNTNNTIVGPYRNKLTYNSSWARKKNKKTN